MIKNHRRSRSLNKREHRKRKKLKEKLLEGMLYLLNLRFLHQIIKNAVSKLAKALTFLVKHIDPPMGYNKTQGPRTHCPFCSIPVIGVMNYLKQNFKNMTNATLVAAKNYFYIHKITTNAPSVILRILKITVKPSK